MAILLTKQRDQDVFSFNDFFSTRLYMRSGTLEDTLKPQGLLWLSLVLFRLLFNVVLKERFEIALQRFHVTTTVTNDLGHRLIKGQRVENMLQAQIFMPSAFRFFDR
jgi:hypothetical protein